jgi:hypothetical protein
MKSNKKLIDVMREAANVLEENPENYDHAYACACTVGYLVQSLMEVTHEGLMEIYHHECKMPGRYWKDEAMYQLANENINFLFKGLYTLGLTLVEDYQEIEVNDTPEKAIAYFRNKANELENLLN